MNKKRSLYRAENHGPMRAVDAMYRGSPNITQATSSQTGFDRPLTRHVPTKTLSISEGYDILKKKAKSLLRSKP